MMDTCQALWMTVKVDYDHRSTNRNRSRSDRNHSTQEAMNNRQLTEHLSIASSELSEAINGEFHKKHFVILFVLGTEINFS